MRFVLMVFFRLLKIRKGKPSYKNRENSYNFYSNFDKAIPNRIPKFSHTSFKKKSHTHHIIPYYSFKYLNMPSNSIFSKVVRGIDRLLTPVPFYFSLTIAISGMFLLLFVFIHHYDSITAINFSKIIFSFLFIKIYQPVNPLHFLLFYSSFFFI